MNRYVIDGLLRDMFTGRLVLCLAWSAKGAQEAFRLCSEAAAERHAEVRVYRANGCERIIAPSGGCICFRSTRQTVRGFSGDVLAAERYAVEVLVDVLEWGPLRASFTEAIVL